MIGFLRGRVFENRAEDLLLDVGGVGYRVYAPSPALSRLKVGEEVLLYTYLAVREDALTLYGFQNREDYRAFEMLISVSGIGPKVALGILSSTTSEKLFQAIHGQNISALTKLPGVGKKSAQRLILELKDKTAEFAPEDAEGPEPESAPPEDRSRSDTAAALLALGYTQQEISSVLRGARADLSTEEVIKYALKEFAGKR